jgi:hypothetical protein
VDIEDRVRGYVCDAVRDCAPDRITAITRFTNALVRLARLDELLR